MTRRRDRRPTVVSGDPSDAPTRHGLVGVGLVTVAFIEVTSGTLGRSHSPLYRGAPDGVRSGAGTALHSSGERSCTSCRFLPETDNTAAWGLSTRGEPRWPASLAGMAAVALYAMLPDRLTLLVGSSALRYWQRDRGGPHARSTLHHRQPDVLLAQMVTPGCAQPGWTPRSRDDLYVSFTNASACCPTDTLPLTGWAKALRLGQALASLLTTAHDRVGGGARRQHDAVRGRAGA